jgi:hypothetical protein
MKSVQMLMPSTGIEPATRNLHFALLAQLPYCASGGYSFSLWKVHFQFSAFNLLPYYGRSCKSRKGTRGKPVLRWADLVFKDFIESHLDVLPTRFSFVFVSLFNERGFASSFQTFKMNHDVTSARSSIGTVSSG